MTLQEKIGITSPICHFAFGATNIGDAAGTMFASEATSPDYIMPWAGSVVAVAVRSNADYTGGVLTFNPTIDGTANTSLGTTMDDTLQSNYAVKPQYTVRFAAGARLGAAWTKTGTVAPTTTDVAASLYVMFDDVNL